LAPCFSFFVFVYMKPLDRGYFMKAPQLRFGLPQLRWTSDRFLLIEALFSLGKLLFQAST
jgi:hypothetical protein